MLAETDADTNCVILAYGRMTKHAVEAADMLEQDGLRVGVIDAWSLKPMDMVCLERLFENGTKIITIEEGEMIGGFGSEIARLCVERGAQAPLAVMGLPNRFIAHGSVDQLLHECGLMPQQLAERIKEALESAEK